MQVYYVPRLNGTLAELRELKTELEDAAKVSTMPASEGLRCKFDMPDLQQGLSMRLKGMKGERKKVKALLHLRGASAKKEEAILQCADGMRLDRLKILQNLYASCLEQLHETEQLIQAIERSIEISIESQVSNSDTL